MILVTGGFGFIGSSLVRSLADSGTPVMVTDSIDRPAKLENLADHAPSHYLDRAELLEAIDRDDRRLDRIERVVHLGARTDTTEQDAGLLLALNYTYSCRLLDFCSERGLPLVYASSAAVYGRSAAFSVDPANERPLNPYAYSKLMFDNRVRDHHRHSPGAFVLGLRFFNVYGPGEEHKGAMASVIRHFDAQARHDGVIRPFGASHGYAAGAQERDFVHVDDIVDVIRWALSHEPTAPLDSIVNVGTGRARTFASVAELVRAHHEGARIDYRPFPDALLPAYQPHTQAELGSLRSLGCTTSFRSIDDGVPSYLDWLGRPTR